MTKPSVKPTSSLAAAAAIVGAASTAVAGTTAALAALATPAAAVNEATQVAGTVESAVQASMVPLPEVKTTLPQVYDSLFEPSKLKVKLLNDAAQMPQYATGGAACFDLHANDSVGVVGGHSVEVSTGLAFEVPVDHVMLVFSRSGHGFKNGVRLANSVGVIDSDYRGEVKVKLHNDGQGDFVVEQGARVAQAMVLPITRMPLLQVEELSATERGEAGFGSTGQ